jgi:hypothetical protein
MRIVRSNSSEIFDSFAEIMQKFNSKIDPQEQELIEKFASISAGVRAVFSLQLRAIGEGAVIFGRRSTELLGELADAGGRGIRVADGTINASLTQAKVLEEIMHVAKLGDEGLASARRLSRELFMGSSAYAGRSGALNELWSATSNFGRAGLNQTRGLNLGDKALLSLARFTGDIDFIRNYPSLEGFILSPAARARAYGLLEASNEVAHVSLIRIAADAIEADTDFASAWNKYYGAGGSRLPDGVGPFTVRPNSGGGPAHLDDFLQHSIARDANQVYMPPASASGRGTFTNRLSPPEAAPAAPPGSSRIGDPPTATGQPAPRGYSGDSARYNPNHGGYTPTVQRAEQAVAEAAETITRTSSSADPKIVARAEELDDFFKGTADAEAVARLEADGFVLSPAGETASVTLRAADDIDEVVNPALVGSIANSQREYNRRVVELQSLIETERAARAAEAVEEATRRAADAETIAELTRVKDAAEAEAVRLQRLLDDTSEAGDPPLAREAGDIHAGGGGGGGASSRAKTGDQTQTIGDTTIHVHPYRSPEVEGPPPGHLGGPSGPRPVRPDGGGTGGGTGGGRGRGTGGGTGGGRGGGTGGKPGWLRRNWPTLAIVTVTAAAMVAYHRRQQQLLNPPPTTDPNPKTPEEVLRSPPGQAHMQHFNTTLDALRIRELIVQSRSELEGVDFNSGTTGYSVVSGLHGRLAGGLSACDEIARKDPATWRAAHLHLTGLGSHIADYLERQATPALDDTSNEVSRNGLMSANTTLRELTDLLGAYVREETQAFQALMTQANSGDREGISGQQGQGPVDIDFMSRNRGSEIITNNARVTLVDGTSFNGFSVASPLRRGESRNDLRIRVDYAMPALIEALETEDGLMLFERLRNISDVASLIFNTGAYESKRRLDNLAEGRALKSMRGGRGTRSKRQYLTRTQRREMRQRERENRRLDIQDNPSEYGWESRWMGNIAPNLVRRRRRRNIREIREDLGGNPGTIDYALDEGVHAISAKSSISNDKKYNDNSTNNNNLAMKISSKMKADRKNRVNRLQKIADEFSDSYYKDAKKGLSGGDEYMRSYYAGLGGMYDEGMGKRDADFSQLYDVSEETGVDLIHSAHPKAVMVADAKGRGGLVENGLEQKRHTHGVALSTPTGNYRANYAWVAEQLKKRGSES